MKVKICGITNITDARNAVNLGVDALGFVFAPSPRKISVSSACKIIKTLPVFTIKVGVFVNENKDKVLNVLRRCKLDVLQFHGEESDKYCAFFQKYCKIIKAIRLKNSDSLEKISEYKHVDAILLDSYDKNYYGGTGKTIPHKLLKSLKYKKPIIVAGGIRANNVRTIIKSFMPYAIDVSSGIETSPGKKSLRQIRDLMQKVKAN
ncbi:MAG: phosphoribosylanthranilate isomerase [Candidatus Omnitrophica bacterium]|nr:phosphoribosylanthranilate isomerase [Candidatus Omnitrophota bacterium]